MKLDVFAYEQMHYVVTNCNKNFIVYIVKVQIIKYTFVSFRDG